MWLAIGLALLIVWALGFFVFKVASIGIHLFVFAAIVAGFIHVARWARSRGLRHRT